MSIPELNLLQEFQDRDGWISPGFVLEGWNDESGLLSWSADPEFLSRLIPFATANGSGSFYAFWRVDDREDLASLPVVIFGDEGGELVVGRDLRDLLRLLTAGSEPYVYQDGVHFDRDEDTEPGGEYVVWLKENFGLAATDDPDAIVGAAQAEYGERFAAWNKRFYEQ